MRWVSDDNVAMLTDLYQLTMAASYFASGRSDNATFDLFVRDLPGNRNFLIASGIDDAIDYLEMLQFAPAAVDYLASLDRFRDDFLDYLGDLRFTGTVWAMQEGEIAFAREPILRVTAPIIEAQIVETFLLNCIGFQTMIASKAARIHLASGDKTFVDFSPRRDHGADAALKAARAAYIAGAVATSNVLAGWAYGIPVSGTMAHSYVLAAEDEVTAFRAFVRDFPDDPVLLIDTFDVEQGARNAVRVAREVQDLGIQIRGVRIDSGDLFECSRRVRQILDEAGFGSIEIFLSGDLDEYRIKELVSRRVAADSFGVGTQLGTSGDEPSLGVVYKLVEDGSGPKMKLSTGKATLPGRKQVFRSFASGRIDHDVIALEDERVSADQALLACVMIEGKRNEPARPLDDIRDETINRLQKLPVHLLALTRSATPYPVHLSESLEQLEREMRSDEHPKEARDD